MTSVRPRNMKLGSRQDIEKTFFGKWNLEVPLLPYLGIQWRLESEDVTNNREASVKMAIKE